MLRAGDVETNPGPYAKNAVKCDTCGDSVTRPHFCTCDEVTHYVTRRKSLVASTVEFRRQSGFVWCIDLR